MIELTEEKKAMLNTLANQAYTTAKAHGFHEGEINDGQALALIHSEVSEALQALRNGNPSSEHIERVQALDEELADIIIRVLDYAFVKGIDIGNAVCEKMKYNLSREYKHGKQF